MKIQCLISVFADEWKEDFFKVADKTQVPAFMGGELTDPDGNPRCETMVSTFFTISKPGKSYIISVTVYFYSPSTPLRKDKLSAEIES